MYRLIILLCLTGICSCKDTGPVKGGIADSIQNKLPLSREQLAFHFNIDTMYRDHQFAGNSIDKLGDSLYVALINCSDGKSTKDQLMVVFNRYTQKETDHMRISDMQFIHVNDSTFTTEETSENIRNIKTWKISEKGKIELKINKLQHTP